MHSLGAYLDNVHFHGDLLGFHLNVCCPCTLEILYSPFGWFAKWSAVSRSCV